MNLSSFSRTIWIRICLAFLTVLSNSIVMPFIVVFFVGLVGVSTASWMIIVIGIISVIGYIVGGKAADYYGRKKIILLGEFFTGIGYFIVAFTIIRENILSNYVFMGFIIVYLFSSMMSPAYSALTIDESTTENRKAVYTVFMWSSYLAIAIGSMIGGILFYQYAPYLFVLLGVVSLISFICVAIWIQDRFESSLKETIAHKSVEVQSDGKVVWKDYPFLLIAMMTFIFVLMDHQLPYYLSLRYTQLFGSEGYQMVGILRAENTLIVVCFTAVIVLFMKKVSNIAGIMSGMVLFFIGYIALSVFQTPAFIYCAMFFVSIGELMYIPARQAIVAEAIPNNKRSTYSGYLGVVAAIGGTAASIFIFLTNYLHPFIFTGIYVMFAIFTFLIIWALNKVLRTV